MTASYTATAKALHWLMAILFFGLLALGFYMHDLPLSPQKLNSIPGTSGPASPPSCFVWLRLGLAPHAPSARAAGEHAAACSSGRPRRPRAALRC
jgi:hypothetical protein